MADIESSPLLLAALTSNKQTAMQDPSMIAPLSRLQLAQAMTQQGTSDAPTGKIGIYGRLAQALLGGILSNQAYSGLQDVLSQRNQQVSDFSKSLYGGTPPVQMQTDAVGPPGLGAAEGGTAGPQAKNQLGYLGQYQFGAPRLAELGLYSPAPDENLSGNMWTGQFHIPDFPGVKTSADFMANPDAQQAAYKLHMGNIDQTIAQTPGAGQMSHAGLEAVAHLGGPAGMQKFVASGGGYNPSDANGTHLSDYYARFGGQGAMPGASMAAPPSGTAPTNIQNPWDTWNKARAVLSDPRTMYNPQLQNVAQQALATAEFQIKTGHWTQTPYGAREDFTGKPEYAPTPRTFTDARGNVGYVGPGGQSGSLAQNPSGFTGNTPEANAMRTMGELGPKLMSGQPLTPQEQASYNVAMNMYQAWKTGNAPTGELGRYPERMPPTGFPPAAPGMASQPGAPAMAGPRLDGAAPPSPGGFQQIAPAPVWTQQEGGVWAAPGQPPHFVPAPRLHDTPGGAVLAAGAGQGPEGVRVISPVDNPAVAARTTAVAQGTETGKQTAETLPRMVRIGTEAQMNIGTIDSALGQLQAAEAKGLPTGYFGPQWAAGLAAMKSAGIDTKAFGVDPEAVSNIQAGRKSLALVAGGIIRNILGPNSEITEGKLSQFIHATPGIETDPMAIQKILQWARAQSIYNRDLAASAMANAHPETGMISPGWEPSYYSRNGFGPIYNPLHGEIEQPSASPTAAAVLAPTFTREQVDAERRRRAAMK